MIEIGPNLSIVLMMLLGVIALAILVYYAVRTVPAQRSDYVVPKKEHDWPFLWNCPAEPKANPTKERTP